MGIEKAVLLENNSQRARLEALVEGGVDYTTDLGEGWNISVALAHLAFWDRRAAGLLHRWDVEGSLPDPVDVNLLNATLLPEWSALDPERAAQLASEAAVLVDAAVETLDPDKADAIVMIGNQFIVDRGRHRREHLDQIEQALGIEADQSFLKAS